MHIGLKSPGQPYTAWSCLTFFAIVTFFNGFAVFMKGNWRVSDFVTAYIGIPYVADLSFTPSESDYAYNLETDSPLSSAFALFYAFWKVVRRTRVHPLEDVDLVTGKTQVDEMEGQWPDEQPKNLLQKVSSSRPSAACFTDSKAPGLVLDRIV